MLSILFLGLVCLPFDAAHYCSNKSNQMPRQSRPMMNADNTKSFKTYGVCVEELAVEDPPLAFRLLCAEQVFEAAV